MTLGYRYIAALLFVALAGCRVEPPIRESSEGVSVGWNVNEYRMGEECFFRRNPHPISGVTVCLLDASTKDACVTSGDDGLFKLPGIPKYTEVLITLTKNGFRSRLVPYQTGRTDRAWVGLDVNPKYNPYPTLISPMIAIERYQDPKCRLLNEHVDKRGAIGVLALLYSEKNGVPILTEDGILSSVSGTKVWIEAKDRNNKGGIKYYQSNVCGCCTDGIKDLEDTAVEIGAGFLTFVNLEQGYYNVHFMSPPNYFCTIGGLTEDIVIWGFRSGEANDAGISTVSTKVPVKDDFSTITVIRCHYASGEDGGSVPSCDVNSCPGCDKDAGAENSAESGVPEQ